MTAAVRLGMMFRTNPMEFLDMRADQLARLYELSVNVAEESAGGDGDV